MITGELHPFFDPAILRTIVETTPWWFAFLLVFLTHLGSVYVLVPIVMLGYWWDYRRMGAWLGAVIGYYGIMATIKSLNSATRPDLEAPVAPDPFPEQFLGWYEHATAIGTTSFPSGNVMAPTIVAGLIVLDTKIGTFRQRLAAMFMVVALVAYSRLALGVHYPVDVIGGFLIGIAFLGAITVIRERVTDETLAMFGLGAICASISLWVINGIFAVPTVEAVSGSHRVVATGAAFGGLAVWYLAHQYYEDPQVLRRTPIPCIGVVFAVVTMYIIHVNLVHPVVTASWTALATAGIVATPWILPDRAAASAWIDQLLGRNRPRETAK